MQLGCRSCKDLGREPMRLSKQQAQRLMNHRWPGNIRELRNVIERAVILSTGSRARLDLAMPDNPDTPPDPLENSIPTGEAGFVTDTEMREQEKANLIAALRYADWRVWGPDGAAGLLGIKPSTLTYRMKVSGITRPIDCRILPGDRICTPRPRTVSVPQRSDARPLTDR
jgi:DNA-binding NtrC family response regulator